MKKEEYLQEAMDRVKADPYRTEEDKNKDLERLKKQMKPAKVSMMYKGFKIHEETDITTGCPLFMIYSKEEWAYGKGLRSSEWDATSLEEAKQFIDSYYDMVEKFD